MTADMISNLTLIAPELILAVGALVLLMIGVYSGERGNTMVTGLAVAILIGAGAWMLLIGDHGQAFGGAFISDPFAVFMTVLTLVGSVVTLSLIHI